MDLVTSLGLLGGFALIAMAMVLGGSPAAFIDLPSILIVIGGTSAITAASFSLAELRAAPRTIMRAFTKREHDPAHAASLMVELAQRARRQGVLGLDAIAGSQPFLQKALTLVVDGTEAEEVEKILHREVNAMTMRHIKSVNLLRRAAEVSPAMGLIGTLVGLVQMLGNLDDPGTIGPAMAVALLTTFYGAILANMVFLPLANKLERNSAEETMLNMVYAIGASSIGRRENPRRLEMLINTLLPPAQRLHLFD